MINRSTIDIPDNPEPNARRPIVEKASRRLVEPPLAVEDTLVEGCEVGKQRAREVSLGVLASRTLHSSPAGQPL